MARASSTRVFSPSSDNELSGQNLLIVMPNEVVATLDDYHGARAQDVANITGHRVLAYERPFSGSDQRYSRRRRQELKKESARIFSTTAALLGQAIESESADGVYLVGHSAATIDVIGVAHAECTEYRGIVATDPPAMRRARRFAEITDYIRYQLLDERRKPDPTDAEQYVNTKQAEKTTSLQRLQRTIGELIVYGGYGKSPGSLELLKELAINQRQLSIAVIFPEHTFTTDRQLQEEIKLELESQRGEDDAPIEVNLLDGKYHSVFDNYQFFGSIVLDSINNSESRRNGLGQ